MMHRLLARSGADPESRAKVEQMQFQHGKSLRPRQFNLGYPGTFFFFWKSIWDTVCDTLMEKNDMQFICKQKTKSMPFFLLWYSFLQIMHLKSNSAVKIIVETRLILCKCLFKIDLRLIIKFTR